MSKSNTNLAVTMNSHGDEDSMLGRTAIETTMPSDGQSQLLNYLQTKRTQADEKKLVNFEQNRKQFLQGASAAQPRLSKSFSVSFKSYPINKTPYHLVQDSHSQYLIKDEPVPTVAPFEHNGAASFTRAKTRPPFVDGRKGPHASRFDLFDNYDKSTYLTKVKRTKCNIKFQDQGKRDENIFRKGGDQLLDLKGRTDMDYDGT